MRLNRTAFVLAVLVIAGAALAATALRARKERTVLDGAVLVAAREPDEQAPVTGVTVTARYGAAVATAQSDSAGFFRLVLPAGLRPGQRVMLEFRHPAYHPEDIAAIAGGELIVVRMTPMRRPAATAGQAAVLVTNSRVRYSTATRTLTNIGAGVRMFQAVNTGNIPCNGRQPCSPDGRWKAGVGAATLDAGPENEFRNARVSCIAGPCPFTRVDVDNFSRGGRVISVTVRDWSDTATFVLQAEVVRPEISNVVRYTYPVILGRTMTFSLPPAAEGPSIEAEIGGLPIVFPLGPNLFLSWATCDARAGGNQSTLYRCELKPGYRFPD